MDSPHFHRGSVTEPRVAEPILVGQGVFADLGLQAESGAESVVAEREKKAPPQEQRRHRLQLDVSDGALKRLDDLQQQLEASSRAEVVRRALALLDIVAEEQARGSRLVLRGEEGEREVVLI